MSEVKPHMVPGALLRVQTRNRYLSLSRGEIVGCPLWLDEFPHLTLAGTLQDGELVIGLGPSNPGSEPRVRVLTRDGLYGVVYPLMVRIVT